MLGHPYILGAQRYPSPACPALMPESVLFQDQWAYPASSSVAATANPTAWPLNSASGTSGAVTFDGAGRVIAAGNQFLELISEQITFNGDKPHSLTLKAPVITTGNVAIQIERQATISPLVYGYGALLLPGGTTGQQIWLYQNGVFQISASIPVVNQGGDVILAAGQWNGTSRLILVSVGGAVVVSFANGLQAAGVNNQAIGLPWNAACSCGGISFSGYAT